MSNESFLDDDANVNDEEMTKAAQKAEGLAAKTYWNPHEAGYNKATKRMMFTPAAMKNAPQYTAYTEPKFQSPSANYHSDYLNDSTFDKHVWNYKKDTAESGWAPGMDDLARIVLDNKGAVKFNKKLITPDGAKYWVDQKNRTLPPDSKKWKVVYTDVNHDKIPEVLVIDGNGNVRYLNGWHIGKKNMDLIKAHQDYIDKTYGTPSDIAFARMKGDIRKGALKLQTWVDENTLLDQENPYGPYGMNDALQKTGYKPRALNPCNLFLRFVVKGIYNKKLNEVTNDGFLQKLIKKLASVIQVNAKMYTKYIANPAHDQLVQDGYTDKAMKKRSGNEAYSPFTRKCGQLIEEIMREDDNTGKKAQLNAEIKAALQSCYSKISNVRPGQYLGAKEPDRVDKRAGQAWNREIWENSVYAY